MLKTQTLKQLCKSVRCVAHYGEISRSWDSLDEWHKAAHPYRVKLTYQGRQMSFDYFMAPALTDEPDAETTLDSLLSDASLCSDSFESFCAEIALDTDSRKAERQYNLCMAQTAKLRRFLGNDFDAFIYADR